MSGGVIVAVTTTLSDDQVPANVRSGLHGIPYAMGVAIAVKVTVRRPPVNDRADALR